MTMAEWPEPQANVAQPDADNSRDFLDHLLEKRFRSVERTSSLAAIVAGAPELRTMAGRIASDLVVNRERIVNAMVPARVDKLTNQLARTMRRHLALRYQYVSLERQDDVFLIQRYVDLLFRFKDAVTLVPPNRLPAAIDRELLRHHDSLKVWVRGKLQAVDALNWFERGGSDTVCAQYSAAIQMEVLGMDASRLLSPILDLGCGSQARLVHYLTGLGYENVVGIDRDGADGLALGCDWFTIPLHPASWGTIIAHQSFSLHFINANLRSSASARQFARAYMRILNALKPGGAFIYAPALPFIESLLPQDNFAVRNRTLTTPELPAVLSVTSSHVSRLR